MGFAPPQMEVWLQQGKFKDDNDCQTFIKDIGKIIGEGMIKSYDSHLEQLQDSCKNKSAKEWHQCRL